VPVSAALRYVKEAASETLGWAVTGSDEH